MKRIRLLVQLVPCQDLNSPLQYEHATRQFLPWTEPCAEDLTIQELSEKVVTRFTKIHRGKGTLNVEYLQDYWGGLLDCSLTVGDAFEDRASGADIKNSVVKVNYSLLPPTKSETSGGSVLLAPESSARPIKRQRASLQQDLGSLPTNVNNGLWDSHHAANGCDYPRAIKRLKLENPSFDVDYPSDNTTMILDYGRAIHSSHGGADQLSPVTQSTGSQRSSHGRVPIPSNPYGTPSSLSHHSPRGLIFSSQDAHVVIPNSPPIKANSTSNVTALETVDFDVRNAKAESPELDFYVHKPYSIQTSRASNKLKASPKEVCTTSGGADEFPHHPQVAGYHTSTQQHAGSQESMQHTLHDKEQPSNRSIENFENPIEFSRRLDDVDLTKPGSESPLNKRQHGSRPTNYGNSAVKSTSEGGAILTQSHELGEPIDFSAVNPLANPSADSPSVQSIELAKKYTHVKPSIATLSARDYTSTQALIKLRSPVPQNIRKREVTGVQYDNLGNYYVSREDGEELCSLISSNQPLTKPRASSHAESAPLSSPSNQSKAASPNIILDQAPLLHNQEKQPLKSQNQDILSEIAPLDNVKSQVIAVERANKKNLERDRVNKRGKIGDVAIVSSQQGETLQHSSKEDRTAGKGSTESQLKKPRLMRNETKQIGSDRDETEPNTPAKADSTEVVSVTPVTQKVPRSKDAKEADLSGRSPKNLQPLNTKFRNIAMEKTESKTKKATSQENLEGRDVSLNEPSCTKQLKGRKTQAKSPVAKQQEREHQMKSQPSSIIDVRDDGEVEEVMVDSDGDTKPSLSSSSIVLNGLSQGKAENSSSQTSRNKLDQARKSMTPAFPKSINKHRNDADMQMALGTPSRGSLKDKRLIQNDSRRKQSPTRHSVSFADNPISTSNTPTSSAKKLKDPLLKKTENQKHPKLKLKEGTTGKGSESHPAGPIKQVLQDITISSDSEHDVEAHNIGTSPNRNPKNSSTKPPADESNLGKALPSFSTAPLTSETVESRQKSSAAATKLNSKIKVHPVPSPAIEANKSVSPEPAILGEQIDPQVLVHSDSRQSSSPRAPARYMSRAISISSNSDSNSEVDSSSVSTSSSEQESETEGDDFEETNMDPHLDKSKSIKANTTLSTSSSVSPKHDTHKLQFVPDKDSSLSSSQAQSIKSKDRTVLRSHTPVKPNAVSEKDSGQSRDVLVEYDVRKPPSMTPKSATGTDHNLRTPKTHRTDGLDQTKPVVANPHHPSLTALRNKELAKARLRSKNQRTISSTQSTASSSSPSSSSDDDDDASDSDAGPAESKTSTAEAPKAKPLKAIQRLLKAGKELNALTGARR